VYKGLTKACWDSRDCPSTLLSEIIAQSAIVLALGMLTHSLQLQKRFTTLTGVVSIDVLDGTVPMHCSQVPWQFAVERDHHRIARAAATSLWTVPLVRHCLAS